VGGGALKDSSTTIPVTEDELVVERRTVDVGTVKVTKSADEREVVITEPVIHDDVRIERRSVDQPVARNAVPKIRIEGDTTIIPVLEEVLVVEKRLMLREEVRVTRVRRESPASQRTVVRREHVDVERSPAPSTPPTPQETDSQEQPT
jgi:uncharacterized protein (TIGR02271 family)